MRDFLTMRGAEITQQLAGFYHKKSSPVDIDWYNDATETFYWYIFTGGKVIIWERKIILGSKIAPHRDIVPVNFCQGSPFRGWRYIRTRHWILTKQEMMGWQ